MRGLTVFIDTAGYWFSYRGHRMAAIGNNLQSFLMWALGVIVAGGLLGLGAPFWFKIFNRLSAMAIPAARATLTAPPKAPGGAARHGQSLRRPARRIQ